MRTEQEIKAEYERMKYVREHCSGGAVGSDFLEFIGAFKMLKWVLDDTQPTSGEKS